VLPRADSCLALVPLPLLPAMRGKKGKKKKGKSFRKKRGESRARPYPVHYFPSPNVSPNREGREKKKRGGGGGGGCSALCLFYVPRCIFDLSDAVTGWRREGALEREKKKKKKGGKKREYGPVVCLHPPTPFSRGCRVHKGKKKGRKT